MENVIQILGVDIDATNLDLAFQRIEGWVAHRQKAYVCVVPVSTIVECQQDPDYKKIINQADMATPDGMPLTWIGRLRGQKQMQRTYGPDLMQKVCSGNSGKKLKHYFYGSTPETINLLETRLKSQTKDLNVVGRHAPHFRKDLDEDQAILDQINESHADVLWIGMSSPKQDFWMHKYRDKLTVPVMIGVGAAFDFLAGVKPQAPRWMQRAGLEWLFRLLCEPKRLWRRYLIGNTLFVYWMIKDMVSTRFRKNRT